jgi:hypothetical protein
MKLRFLVVCLAFAFLSIAAQAQVGIYVNPVGMHISNSTADTGPFAFLGDGVKSRMFWGADFGGYYDFWHGAKVDGGIDIRDTLVGGNNAKLNSFMVGAKVSRKRTEARALIPYAEFTVGVGTSKPPTSVVHVSSFQFGVLGGVDYTLSRHVDFRAVEVGYGLVSTVSSASFNGVLSIPQSRLLSVSTGLVFRFGK